METTDNKRVKIRIRRLDQQQPTRQDIVRCSPALVEDIDYRKTRFKKLETYSLGCYLCRETGELAHIGK